MGVESHYRILLKGLIYSFTNIHTYPYISYPYAYTYIWLYMVKSTCHFCGDPRLRSQHSHGGLPLSLTLVPGNSVLSPDLHQTST